MNKNLQEVSHSHCSNVLSVPQAIPSEVLSRYPEQISAGIWWWGKPDCLITASLI